MVRREGVRKARQNLPAQGSRVRRQFTPPELRRVLVDHALRQERDGEYVRELWGLGAGELTHAGQLVMEFLPCTLAQLRESLVGEYASAMTVLAKSPAARKHWDDEWLATVKAAEEEDAPFRDDLLPAQSLEHGAESLVQTDAVSPVDQKTFDRALAHYADDARRRTTVALALSDVLRAFGADIGPEYVTDYCRHEAARRSGVSSVFKEFTTADEDSLAHQSEAPGSSQAPSQPDVGKPSEGSVEDAAAVHGDAATPSGGAGTARGRTPDARPESRDSVPLPEQPRESDPKFETFLSERATPEKEAEIARLAYYFRYKPRLSLGDASADEVEKGHALRSEYLRLIGTLR